MDGTDATVLLLEAGGSGEGASLSNPPQWVEVRDELERGMLVKTLAENTQNSKKWRVNWNADEQSLRPRDPPASPNALRVWGCH